MTLLLGRCPDCGRSSGLSAVDGGLCLACSTKEDAVTDEGQTGNPLDEIEAIETMRNVARLEWAFYTQLIEEGFSETEALTLVIAHVHGAAGGKLDT